MFSSENAQKRDNVSKSEICTQCSCMLTIHYRLNQSESGDLSWTLLRGLKVKYAMELYPISI